MRGLFRIRMKSGNYSSSLAIMISTAWVRCWKRAAEKRYLAIIEVDSTPSSMACACYTRTGRRFDARFWQISDFMSVRRKSRGKIYPSINFLK